MRRCMGRARGRQRQQNTAVLHIADRPNSQNTTVNGKAVASEPRFVEMQIHY